MGTDVVIAKKPTGGIFNVTTPTERLLRANPIRACGWSRQNETLRASEARPQLEMSRICGGGAVLFRIQADDPQVVFTRRASPESTPKVRMLGSIPNELRRITHVVREFVNRHHAERRDNRGSLHFARSSTMFGAGQYRHTASSSTQTPLFVTTHWQTPFSVNTHHKSVGRRIVAYTHARVQ